MAPHRHPFASTALFALVIGLESALAATGARAADPKRGGTLILTSMSSW
jgi:hypothetical protein